MPEREPSPPSTPAHMSTLERVTRVVRRRIETPITVYNEDLGYTSIANPYGYTLKQLADGTIIFDPKGIKNRSDRFLDKFIRSVDEHVLRDPKALFRRHRGMVMDQVKSGPKRSRGPTEAVLANADRLGLS